MRHLTKWFRSHKSITVAFFAGRGAIGATVVHSTILALVPAILVALSASIGMAADAPEKGSEKTPEKVLLRYKFQPGAELRWNVIQQGNVRTSVSGTTQTAETVSKSVKLWRITEVDGDGNATFEHSVENVDMRQKLTGRAELRYNSKTDKEAPLGFQDVAAAVGKPLTIIQIDRQGKTLLRHQTKYNKSVPNQGQIVIPFPEEPIAVGHTWSFPYEVSVSLESGGVRKVQTRQRFTLKSVEHGIAVVHVSTQILTPVQDPAIEAQLAQREASGDVRFDIDAGRIVSQQLDLDKRVIGFRGKASSLHYRTRFTEKFIGTAEMPSEEKQASVGTNGSRG